MSEEHLLVDGYSILHQWDELKRDRIRSLAAGRRRLVQLLTQFHDCRPGSLTVVFDGRSGAAGGDEVGSGIEVIYSRKGQSADALIERMVGGSGRPQTFLVATDDRAERGVIEGLGGRTISADDLRLMVAAELKELSRTLEVNRARNLRFARRR